VMGITFKENCPDIRNSRVIDVISELKEFGCDITVSDYWADKDEVQREYNIDLIHNSKLNIQDYNTIVLAVSHDKYKVLNIKTDKNIVFDIKSILKDSDGKL
ncbi:MAG: UDP binding domain-containing protein, partial [Campylobacterota bacterium]|nr:UDP binding domain-containing protein [Campylobacterota bacterium]